jgi:hypothetical protein
MPNLSDVALHQKGLHISFRELGEVETVRFLSQISHEPKNYLAQQEELFKGMTIDDIYENAKSYADKKKNIYAVPPVPKKTQIRITD